MSLTVTVAINGDPILTITATNRGPAGGDYTDGDHPGGPGPRTYFWQASDGRSGHLVHRRDLGTAVLASALLDHWEAKP